MTTPAGPTPPSDAASPPADTAWMTTTEIAEGPDLAKEQVSTFLSTVALVMVTAGVTVGLWSHAGPWALCAGGVTLAVLVSFADYLRRPRPLPEVDPDPEPPKGPPGPTSPGNLHTKGPGAEQ